ncbi:MAG: hypothetical protein IPP43_10690 [Chitinophagaceae bacterium]|nr:hypothetical protein [Chitinophagaceae bacterium]
MSKLQSFQVQSGGQSSYSPGVVLQQILLNKWTHVAASYNYRRWYGLFIKWS